MMLAILIPVIVMCAIYIWHVHTSLKREFKDKEWMDSEEHKDTEADIFLN